MTKKFNSEKFRIKKAEISDVDAFYNLFKYCVKKQFPEYSPKAKDLFLKKYFTKKIIVCDLKKGNIDLFLAFTEKEVVGYLLALLPYGGVSYISWLSVNTAFQGRGIGRALLKAYEKSAKEKKISKVHLWTSKRNLNFYKKQGWVLVGCIPDNYFGADDWLFYKTIQKSRF